MKRLFYNEADQKTIDRKTVQNVIQQILEEPELIRPSEPADLNGSDIVLDQVTFSYQQVRR